jgi:hypothetical protein
MNPLLVILGVAALTALIPRKKRLPQPTGSPLALPIGINTGFPAPPVQVNITSSPVGGSANSPSTAASGVPNFAPQTVAQQLAKTTPPPTSATQMPSFYNTFSPWESDHSSIPDIEPYAVPMSPPSCGHGCGCGGSCKKTGASTSCSSARAVASSDCLAPAAIEQIKNTPPSVFHMWANNVSSQKFGMFAALQATRIFAPSQSEHDSQGQSPASPFLDGGLGIGNRASAGY